MTTYLPRPFRPAALLIAIAVSLAACGSDVDPGGETGDPATSPDAGGETAEMTEVSFSEVIHSIFYAPQYVAMSEGFFEKEGLDVSLSTANGGDKLTAALLGGHADIGLGGPETAILVNVNPESATELRIVGNLTNSDGTFLVCRGDAEVSDMEDLVGKEVIGWRPASTPQLVLEQLLRDIGIESDVDVRTNLDPGSAPAAFSQGEGDCITVFEPVASLLEAGGAEVVASLGERLGEVPYTAYLVNSNFLEGNEDVVTRWLSAVRAAKQWVEDHEASEVAESVQSQFPDADTDSLTSAIQRYKDIGIWSPEIVPTEQGFERLVGLLREGGVLDEEVNYGDVVTTGLVEE